MCGEVWGSRPEQSVFSNALLWASLLANQELYRAVKQSFDLTLFLKMSLPKVLASTEQRGNGFKRHVQPR